MAQGGVFVIVWLTYLLRTALQEAFVSSRREVKSFSSTPVRSEVLHSPDLWNTFWCVLLHQNDGLKNHFWALLPKQWLMSRGSGPSNGCHLTQHPFCSADCCIVRRSRPGWVTCLWGADADGLRFLSRVAQLRLCSAPPVTVISEIWNPSPIDRTKSSNLIVKKADLTKLLSNWFKHQSILHYACLFSFLFRDTTLPRTGWGTSFTSGTAQIRHDVDHAAVIKSKPALSKGAISGSSGWGNKIYNAKSLKCENEKHVISLLMF